MHPRPQIRLDSWKAVSRRTFLKVSLSVIAVSRLPGLWAQTAGKGFFRACVIGCTGKGDYGHGHDLIFAGREDVRLVAVADPNPEGLANAIERTGARKGYADYREMIDREKPQLVSIAPRWTDQHHAVGMAALRAGAHVWLEKPITQTLAEADELLNRARNSGLKISVAHQMRLAPSITHLKKSISDGGIGDICAMHAHGKQDHRAGGEDLIVLGTHLFDLMRYFSGDAQWCSARVLQSGRDMTNTDARGGTENIGPIAGDEIVAQFAFGSGIEGTFTSRAKARDTLGHWGIRLVGTRAQVRILADIVPRVFIQRATPWSNAGRQESWQPLPDAPAGPASTALANAHLVDDWLAAIREDREPVSSGYSGMRALEMALAVFEAGLKRTRVALPLERRAHPLQP